MQMQSRLRRISFHLRFLIVLAGLLVLSNTHAVSLNDVTLAQAKHLFEDATHIGNRERKAPVKPVYRENQLLGYLLLTNEVAPIPAYSGKPVAVLVGLDLKATIQGIQILEHEEPILVIGVTDQHLAEYTAQYRGQSAWSKIRVGAHNREGYIGVDGISGATITAMVLNRSIMRSAQRISQYYGLPLSDKPVTAEPVTANPVSLQNKRQPQPAVASVAEIEPVVEPLETSKQTVIGEPVAEKGIAQPIAEAVQKPAIQSSALPTDLQPVAAFSPSAYTEDPLFDLNLIWKEKGVQLVLILIALAVLIFILFFQDWLVVRTRLFRRIRLAYLIFTVVFIGYYCMAQLSIMNVLAFIQLLIHDFTWETLMIDPLIFMLWGFVAISIILWGRGVYCGWLCPFGAMQELIHKLARKLGIKSYQFPQMVHERLWAIKYIVLILLVGVSLESLATASAMAEIEPFKTALTMKFQREWGYVFYAVVLLVISAFNSKFFCKYLCPLGAGLSFINRFRVFDWLRRRKECGRPCQTCASICQISAIKHTGEIIDTECHYCLECQVDYWDDCLCPPLIEKRKKRERRSKRSQQTIALEVVD